MNIKIYKTSYTQLSLRNFHLVTYLHEKFHFESKVMEEFIEFYKNKIKFVEQLCSQIEIWKQVSLLKQTSIIRANL